MVVNFGGYYYEIPLVFDRVTQFMEECRGYERYKMAMVIGLMA